MRSPRSLLLKHEFLKKWAMGLQVCSATEKDMTILERKKAIKLSADVAMASARTVSTCWSRALIANASKNNENKIIVDNILGGGGGGGGGANESQNQKKIKKASMVSISRNNIVLRSKKIFKKSCSIRRRVNKIAPPMALASSIAKRLVKKRTQVLKRLVPGGESMDEFSLIEETLDYIASLRAQVDVMRCLANATENLKRK